MAWAECKVGTPICHTEWRYVFDGEDFEKRFAMLAKIAYKLDDNIMSLYIAEKHRKIKEADEDIRKEQLEEKITSLENAISLVQKSIIVLLDIEKTNQAKREAEEKAKAEKRFWEFWK